MIARTKPQIPHVPYAKQCSTRAEHARHGGPPSKACLCLARVSWRLEHSSTGVPRAEHARVQLYFLQRESRDTTSHVVIPAP
jgi:hypothetical protein